MRFLLDSARADNESIMHCGSVCKIYNKMLMSRKCDTSSTYTFFSLKLLNYRGADRYVYV